jgi:hypothetical protein
LSLDQQPRYTSTLSNTVALLDETYQVMRQITLGNSLEDVRRQVIEDNLLGKKSERSRQNAWANVYFRYFSHRDEGFIDLLTETITSSIPEKAKRLILFFELAQADALIHDLTIQLLFDLYEQGRSLVAKQDILEWMDQNNQTHPEIGEWAPQTRERMIRHYLSLARDFGLLEGSKHKSFTKPYVPLGAFLWALYRLRDQGLSTKAIIESDEFKLFFMSQNDVVFLLNEATSSGYLSFRSAGDIYDLSFNDGTLAEVMDGLTSQV